MNRDINEPVRIFGLTLIQSKVVQKESSKWIKEAHPNFRIFKSTTAVAVLLGVAGWHLDLHPVMPLVALVPLLVYSLAIDKLLKEYDKQAPDEFKIK